MRGFFTGLLKFALFVAVVSIGMNWSDIKQGIRDLWWENVTMAPDINGVNALMLAGHAADAIPRVTALLEAHPDDARLLYVLAGAYADDRRSIASYVALKAYFKAAAGTPEEHSARRYYADKQLKTYEGSRGLLAAARERNFGAIEAFNNAPNAWRKIRADYLVADVLSSPASRADSVPGFLANKPFARFWDDCRASHCEAIYKHASLIASARSDAVRLPFDDVCCSISLRDEDLADDFLVNLRKISMQRFGGDRIGTDAAQTIQFLDAYRRAMLKRLFVLNFVTYADYWERRPAR